jgi:hypothetical protein
MDDDDDVGGGGGERDMDLFWVVAVSFFFSEKSHIRSTSLVCVSLSLCSFSH